MILIRVIKRRPLYAAGQFVAASLVDRVRLSP